MELGVLVIHGRVHHPQTQGKMERFNRTETEECFDLPHYNFRNYGFDETIYSPPTIISIYSPPTVNRVYAGKRLQSIEYMVNPKATPYDIGPIWTPCK